MGDRLIAGGDRVSIIDASDPRYLRLVAEERPTSNFVGSVAAEGSRLYVGGGYTPAIAIVEVECLACAADLNADGSADSRDVIAFLGAWATERAQDCSSGECSTDLDDNGVVDTRDFVAFLNAWSAGC